MPTGRLSNIKNGVVRQIYYLRAARQVREEISAGLMENPYRSTHGGRVKLIQSGELNIDVAFSACRAATNLVMRTALAASHAAASFGVCAGVDAQYAKCVVP